MGNVNWRGGLRRLGLIYAGCSVVAVAVVLLGEPFWVSVCPRSYTEGPKGDPVDEQRYAQDIRRQIDSGCLIRPLPKDMLGQLEWQAELYERRVAGGDVSLRHLRDRHYVSPEAKTLAERAAERLGPPKRPPTCEPVRPVAVLPAETVQLAWAEVVRCSVGTSFYNVEKSRGLRLALLLVILPFAAFGLFKTGRWVWRGFRSE